MGSAGAGGFIPSRWESVEPAPAPAADAWPSPAPPPPPLDEPTPHHHETYVLLNIFFL